MKNLDGACNAKYCAPEKNEIMDLLKKLNPSGNLKYWGSTNFLSTEN